MDFIVTGCEGLLSQAFGSTLKLLRTLGIARETLEMFRPVNISFLHVFAPFLAEKENT